MLMLPPPRFAAHYCCCQMIRHYCHDAIRYAIAIDMPMIFHYAFRHDYFRHIIITLTLDVMLLLIFSPISRPKRRAANHT
jgi:hypothetical protein